MWKLINRLVVLNTAGASNACRAFTNNGSATLLAKTTQPSQSSAYRNERTINGESSKEEKVLTEGHGWKQKKNIQLSEGENHFGRSKTTCYRCGQEGHISKDCPSGTTSFQRQGPSESRWGSSKAQACYKCGEEGHKSRDCPKRNSYERETTGRREHGMQDKSDNANFSEIGFPSKWKVGAGFEQYANELRGKVKKYSDFNKKPSRSTKTFERRPIVKQDPGIRRQAKLLEVERENVEEDELNNEVDPMKAHEAYDDHVANRAALKEQIQMRIIKKKYFREPQEVSSESPERKLSWSEKAQIRHLYNSDPQAWTFNVLAEHFNIDSKVAKAVATANWQPSKPKEGEDMISSLGEQEVFPLVNVRTSGTEAEEVLQQESSLKHRSYKKLTFSEFSASRGEINPQSESSHVENKPGIFKESENLQSLHDAADSEASLDHTLVLKYMSAEGSISKWKNNQHSDSPQLKIDSETDTPYYYDAKHGYQHPLGKPAGLDDDDKSPLIKENNHLYRKGDAFYSEEGEFLYRVPGLQKTS